MRRLRFLYLLALVSMFSCEAIKSQSDYVLLLTDKEILSSSKENYFKIEFEVPGKWTTSISYNENENASWCELLTDKGNSGVCSSVLKVLENTTGKERYATITISCGEANQAIRVKQEQNSLIVPENTDIRFGAEGGRVSIKVDSNVAFNSRLSEEGQLWISTNLASDRQSIQISVDANDIIEERVGTISLFYEDYEVIISVSQEAASPILSIAKKYFDIPAGGGEITITTKSNSESSCQVDDDCTAWLRLIETRALSESSYVFSISKNETLSPREGQIVFSSGILTDTVTVFQRGISPSISISSSYYEAPVLGGRVDIAVTSNFPYEVSVPSYCSNWIEHNSTMTNTETFLISENTSPEARSAEILFTVGDKTKTLRIYQNGCSPIITIDTDSFRFDDLGGSGLVNVESNCTFEVSSPSWISTNIEKGQGDLSKLSFKVYQNYNADSRSGYIKLSGFGLTRMISVYQSAKKFEVTISLSEAGTLSNYLGSSNKYTITHLTIEGPINGKDIKLLRNLYGCRVFPSYYGGSTEYINTTGILEFLDLSNATIVAGGGCCSMKKYYYGGGQYEESSSYSTRDNTITPYMFTDCYKLNTVILPKSVTVIEQNAFYDHSLSSITLPDQVSEINCCFSSDHSSTLLSEIKIDKNNSHFCVKDGVLFSKDMKTLYACPPMNPVGNVYSIPSSVNRILPYAFYACKGIQSIIIPESITEIGSYAFALCSLDEIEIRTSVKYGILGYHTSFKKVIIDSGFTEFNAEIFASTYSDLGICEIGDLWVYCSTPPIISVFHPFNSTIINTTTLHIPAASLDLYKLATCWGEFKRIKSY